MPFTLAHPMAVLPLSRCRWTHFPALVLGSMAPDFVYFLGGRAAFGVGHTLWGALEVDLPLCFVFYGIYGFLWRGVLRDYLPDAVNAVAREVRQPVGWREWVRWVWIFAYSALFGIATHVFLDDFTHQSGYFVVHLPILREEMAGLACFKWLQYGGGVLGLTLCLAWAMWTAHGLPPSKTTSRAKWRFWGIWAIGVLIWLVIWQAVDAIAWGNVATWVIRVVDGGAVVLTVLGIFFVIQSLKKD